MYVNLDVRSSKRYSNNVMINTSRSCHSASYSFACDTEQPLDPSNCAHSSKLLHAVNDRPFIDFCSCLAVLKAFALHRISLPSSQPKWHVCSSLLGQLWEIKVCWPGLSQKQKYVCHLPARKTTINTKTEYEKGGGWGGSSWWRATERPYISKVDGMFHLLEYGPDSCEHGHGRSNIWDRDLKVNSDAVKCTVWVDGVEDNSISRREMARTRRHKRACVCMKR